MRFVTLVPLMATLLLALVSQDCNASERHKPWPRPPFLGFHKQPCGIKTGRGLRLNVTPLDSFSCLFPFCCRRCRRTPECVTFNFNDRTSMCELLGSNLVPFAQNVEFDDDWNFYTFNRKPIPADAECPDGSILVPYDILKKETPDPSIKGYTCTSDSWILEEYNSGKIDCRLVLHYFKDFPGHDSAGYSRIVSTYDEAFEECLANNCTGLAYSLRTEECWLKIETPTEVQGRIRYHPHVHYWEMVCV